MQDDIKTDGIADKDLSLNKLAEKDINDITWLMFEKTGGINYYLLNKELSKSKDKR